MDVIVGQARTPEERAAVHRLRYDIYGREMNLDSDAVDHAAEVITDANDEHGRLLTATVDGELVGTVRVHWGGDAPLPEEFRRTYHLDMFEPTVNERQMVVFTRLMVRPAFRGTMVPVQLFAAIAQLAVDVRARLSFCDCQPHLLNLYTGIGYRTYAHTENDPLMGLLVPLVLVVEDLDHLRRTGSPLLSFSTAEGFTPDHPADILRLLPASPAIGTVPVEAAAAWARGYGLLAGSDGRVGFFDGIADEDLHHVVDRGFVIRCERGDLVIQDRAVDRTMFVVLSGLLEVVEGEEVVAVAAPGDVLGELAFLLHGDRTATVRAASDDVEVLSLNEKALLRLQEAQPHLAAQVFLNLSRALATKLVSLHETVWA